MIFVRANPEYDGTFTIEVGTKEELEYLSKNKDRLLNEFVQSHIKNIEKMSIQTWDDYVKFVHASPKDQLEMIEGKSYSALEVDDIDVKATILAALKATESMTYDTLETFLNQKFQSSDGGRKYD